MSSGHSVPLSSLSSASEAGANVPLAIDIEWRTSGDLSIGWPESDIGVLSAEHVAGIADMNATLGHLESRQRSLAHAGSAVTDARLVLGRALGELLDGPKQILSHYLRQALENDNRLALAVRLRLESNHRASLCEHPAIGWRWELIADETGHLLTGAPPYGCAVTLAVQLGDRSVMASRRLDYGDQNILFMACSPIDGGAALDFEREEELVLRAVEPFVARGRANMRVVETGSLRELCRMLVGNRTEIVHLSGHGEQTLNGPRLLMGGETGRNDPVSPDQLFDVLKRAPEMPSLVMLSSCHSAGAHNGVSSFAAQLVARGVPSVIGWEQPISDDLATQAAADIYQRLCSGHNPAQSVAFARKQLFKTEYARTGSATTWATLRLFTHEAAGYVVDLERPRQRSHPSAIRETYRYLANGKMRVLTSGFVGRRRPLQRLIRVLRPGHGANAEQAGAVILGTTGVGKSCLAARAIQRTSQEYEDTGTLGTIVLSGQLDDALVLAQFEEQAMRWGDIRAAGMLRDGQLARSLSGRIRWLICGHWRRRPLIIVLDDFEQNLELQLLGHARVSPYAADLLDVLVPACRTSKARLVITSTASIELPAQRCDGLVDIRLGPFEASSVRKLWIRGQSVHGGAQVSTGLGSDTIQRGELANISPTTWSQLADRLGRNPRILDWARTLLRGQTPAEISEVTAQAGSVFSQWSSGTAPSHEQQEELARVFLLHMAYERAIGDISADTREFVRRARVYAVAVPARAFQAMTDGLEIQLDAHLPALQNVGLLEIGELGGEPAYRVSPLVEPQFATEDNARWHSVAAEFWEHESHRAERFTRLEWAWSHALNAQMQDLADRLLRHVMLGYQIRHLIHRAYQLAHIHLGVFPSSVIALAAAGHAACLGGDPAKGWEYCHKAESAPEYAHLSDEMRSVLLGECASVLAHLGNYTGAAERLERAISLMEAAWPAASKREQHWLAWCLHELARVRTAQGETEQAIEHAKRSLVIKKLVFGTDVHGEVASSLHTLAEAYNARGELRLAREYLERCLAMKAHIFGSDVHSSVASSLLLMGKILIQQGQYQLAKKYIERALVIYVELFGTESHHNVANALNDLAGVVLAQGDVTLAKQYLERSMSILLEVLGTDIHPSIAGSLHEQGRVLMEQGNLESSRRNLERALVILRDAYGTDEHPSVAGAIHMLAGVFAAQGKPRVAIQHLERALSIQTKVLGTDIHPDVASTIHDIARMFEAQGKLDMAREYLERALAIWQEVFGTDVHPSVATAMNTLAKVLVAQGDATSARQCLERSTAILVEVHGTEWHRDIAGALQAMAVIENMQGETSRARQNLERSMEIRTRVGCEEVHPDTAATLHALGTVLKAEGQLTLARQTLERALDVWEQIFGTQVHPNAAASLHELAQVLQAQGELALARQYLERVLAIWEQVFNTEIHPNVATSLNQLAGIQYQEGHGDDAIDTFRRALRIATECHGSSDNHLSAQIEISLAVVLSAAGNVEEAQGHLVHGVEVLLRQMPDSPLVAQLRQQYGPLFAALEARISSSEPVSHEAIDDCREHIS